MISPRAACERIDSAGNLCRAAGHPVCERVCVFVRVYVCAGVKEFPRWGCIINLVVNETRLSLSPSPCVYRFSNGRAKIEFRFVWTNLYRHSVFKARPSTYQNRARTISYSAEQNREEVARRERNRGWRSGGGGGGGYGRVVFYRVPFGLHTVNISHGKRVAGADGGVGRTRV